MSVHCENDIGPMTLTSKLRQPHGHPPPPHTERRAPTMMILNTMTFTVPPPNAAVGPAAGLIAITVRKMMRKGVPSPHLAQLRVCPAPLWLSERDMPPSPCTWQLRSLTRLLVMLDIGTLDQEGTVVTEGAEASPLRPTMLGENAPVILVVISLRPRDRGPMESLSKNTIGICMIMTPLTACLTAVVAEGGHIPLHFRSRPAPPLIDPMEKPQPLHALFPMKEKGDARAPSANQPWMMMGMAVIPIAIHLYLKD
mmetsp:Transcript_7911/g.17162  ORF Transcript_7911/g.17162 Transcript_7911/m.17162 type:complete len:254 (+) Transcript_7911:3419-4180(+)